MQTEDSWMHVCTKLEKSVADHYIAWLEVKRFNQQYELDLGETFSLVTKITTV